MTRNSLLVAAIVAALGLGAGLWFALEPAGDGTQATGDAPAMAAPQPVAAARPGSEQTGSEQTGSEQTGGEATDQGQAQGQAPASQPAAGADSGEQAASEAADGAPAPQPPSFDIVRVEKDGSTVIAGRAPSGSQVTLFDGETALGSAKAGADGSFALILDQPLPPGSRALSLAATTSDGTMVPSADEVVVVVPEPAPQPAAVMAAASPAPAATGTASTAQAAADPAAEPAAQPAATGESEATATQAAATASASGTETATTDTAATGETASAPEPAAIQPTTPPAATQPATTQPATTQPAGTQLAATQPAAQPATPIVVASGADGASVVLQAPGDLGGDTLRIAAVDYDLEGQVIVSGNGPAGGAVTLYLDGAPLGQAKIDDAGRWVFRPEAPVATGLHRLRADLLAADGSVTARAEIPFSRAEPLALAPDQNFVVVQPGNSLWVIARGKYGEGLRYTAIYEANAGQIRDPDLIYPGQIFLVPQVN